jgi:hypothetical protein
MYSSAYFSNSPLDGGGWSAHAAAALTWGKSYKSPFERRLSGSQNRSGRYAALKILGLTGTRGARGSVVIGVLCYKQEGRGFDL